MYIYIYIYICIHIYLSRKETQQTAVTSEGKAQAPVQVRNGLPNQEIVNIYIYIYIYIYTLYACVYIMCIYIYICIHTSYSQYIYIYIYIYVSMYIYVCVCIYIYIYVSIQEIWQSTRMYYCTVFVDGLPCLEQCADPVVRVTMGAFSAETDKATRIGQFNNVRWTAPVMVTSKVISRRAKIELLVGPKQEVLGEQTVYDAAVGKLYWMHLFGGATQAPKKELAQQMVKQTVRPPSTYQGTVVVYFGTARQPTSFFQGLIAERKPCRLVVRLYSGIYIHSLAKKRVRVHIYTYVHYIYIYIYIYAYTYAYTYEYKCVYMCMYMCIYVYVYMYMYMYVCVYVYIYIYINMYVYIYIYVDVYVCMYVCMYIYIYICMYVYIYIYIYIYIWSGVEWSGTDLAGGRGATAVGLHSPPLLLLRGSASVIAPQARFSSPKPRLTRGGQGSKQGTHSSKQHARGGGGGKEERGEKGRRDGGEGDEHRPTPAYARNR